MLIIIVWVLWNILSRLLLSRNVWDWMCWYMVRLSVMIWWNILVSILMDLFLCKMVGYRVMVFVVWSYWLLLVILVVWYWLLWSGWSMCNCWLINWWKGCWWGWWLYFVGCFCVKMLVVKLLLNRLCWCCVMKWLIWKLLELVLFRLMNWCCVKVYCCVVVIGMCIFSGV